MTGTNPLTPDQQQALSDAGRRASRILAAGRVASFNGWSLGIIAAISLLFAFGSLTALVMGVGLGWIAWNEFRGRDRLRALDPDAPAFLGRNQLTLLTLIIVYAVFSIYHTLTTPIPDLAEIEEMVGPIGDTLRSAMVAVYAIVIALTAVVQGLNARYYFARRPMLETYLAETPEWVVELQRTART